MKQTPYSALISTYHNANKCKKGRDKKDIQNNQLNIVIVIEAPISVFITLSKEICKIGAK